MKDFPIFPTEYGVASLFLKEIPYRQEAYTRIRDVQPGKLPELLAECAGFCTMAGAGRVYAAGHEDLDRYPLQGSVYTMQGTAWVDPENDLVYVFLSNRTYPDATNRKLMQLDIRGQIQEAMYEALK